MTTPYRVGFCVSGEGRLFRSAVRWRHRLGIQPALLVATDRADPQLESFCREFEVPFTCLHVQPRETFTRDITRVCIGAQVDLLCLTFDRILPDALVQHYRGRIINTHFSLLPAFPGVRPLSDALDAGARFVGATIHEVDQHVDGGAIVAQCMLPVERADTRESLGRRVFSLARPMYLQVLAWYAAGRVERDPHGRVWIRDGRYGLAPMSPALEREFPD